MSAANSQRKGIERLARSVRKFLIPKSIRMAGAQTLGREYALQDISQTQQIPLSPLIKKGGDFLNGEIQILH